jgi:dTDP-4-dehydrorhamnose 3,5-epimerase
MIFRETDLDGVVVIDLEKIEDERGYFARTWCWKEFFDAGLETTFVQCSVSHNRLRGTLRGMHFQVAPSAEGKLIRCTRGRVFDVAVDVRPGSPTRGNWVSVELSADTGRMIYISEGFAHGFQTLEDGSELFYQMTAAYDAKAARGLRWDDPALAIAWPIPEPTVLSARDRTLPRLAEVAC